MRHAFGFYSAKLYSNNFHFKRTEKGAHENKNAHFMLFIKLIIKSVVEYF